MIKRKINSVSVVDNSTIITIQNVAPKDISLLFNKIAEKNICVSITNYTVGDSGKLNLCFAFSDELLGDVMCSMGEVSNNYIYSVSADNSQILLEIEDVTAVDETLCHMLKAMNDANVYVKLISASVNKIYVIVGNMDIDKALQGINKLKR